MPGNVGDRPLVEERVIRLGLGNHDDHGDDEDHNVDGELDQIKGNIILFFAMIIMMIDTYVDGENDGHHTGSGEVPEECSSKW